MSPKYFIVGGNPDRTGGGLIEVVFDRFIADRRAAYYVSLGYYDVRVLSEDAFYGDY